MGLSICFQMALPPGTSDADAAALVSRLHEHALGLPFAHVSSVVRLTEETLAGPWPIHGLAYERLEDVAHVGAVFAREDLYRRRLAPPDDEYEYTPVEVPPELPTVAHAFAVAPGRECEPASFGVARLTDGDAPATWGWQCCCKTQYASALGDEHLLRCHGALVTLLDAAVALGFEVTVHDEAGYWDSRDPRQLVEAVAGMNRLIARFAGALTDAVRDAGGDSRELRGAIFDHPDFERLETTEE